MSVRVGGRVGSRVRVRVRGRPSSPSPARPPSHEVSSEPSRVSKVAMHVAGQGMVRVKAGFRVKVGSGVRGEG